jgi:hypothetical protein
MFEDRK